MAASRRTPSEPSRQSSVDRGDDELLDALRLGDERVFTKLVESWSGVMLRLALSHLDNRAVAEEIVQEAWLTVVRSLERFERRSALRTWVLGIVVILDAILALPPTQREVIALRDIDGLGAADVCKILGLTDTLDGQGRKSFKPGRVYHEAVNTRMQARNPSATRPTELIPFQVGGKGEPLLLMAKPLQR